MELELCGNSHCPKVVSTKDGVVIGEKKNLVRLKASEWNALVEGVENGKLHRI